MDARFVAPTNNDVTESFLMYLRPLLGKGMPSAYRLRPNKVAKILASDQRQTD